MTLLDKHCFAEPPHDRRILTETSREEKRGENEEDAVLCALNSCVVVVPPRD